MLQKCRARLCSPPRHSHAPMLPFLDPERVEEMPLNSSPNLRSPYAGPAQHGQQSEGAIGWCAGFLPDGGALPAFLEGKRVMALDLGLLIAGAKERGELEQRITNLISEIRAAGNVVLMSVSTLLFHVSQWTRGSPWMMYSYSSRPVVCGRGPGELRKSPLSGYCETIATPQCSASPS